MMARKEGRLGEGGRVAGSSRYTQRSRIRLCSVTMLLLVYSMTDGISMQKMSTKKLDVGTDRVVVVAKVRKVEDRRQRLGRRDTERIRKMILSDSSAASGVIMK